MPKPPLAVSAAQRQRWRSILKTVTAIPTAAGHEHGVIGYVDRWLAERPHLICKPDGLGNRVLQRKSVRGKRPVFLTAHLDHPAFVVHPDDQPAGQDGHKLTARFLGGVKPGYFIGTPVQLCKPKPNGPGFSRVAKGHVTFYSPSDADRWWPECRIRLEKPVRAAEGMILTWDLPKPGFSDGQLHAPVCDDLAGLVAALCAFDLVYETAPDCDTRLLLTRAEEVGLLGAIHAAENETIPPAARLICLETSKALPNAPIGGGPIVRVGDKSGVFDRNLTAAVGEAAQALQALDPKFQFQRRLMDGGSCEATAFCALGYEATCCCLALGNYHNMNETTGKIDRETIGLDDFNGLVRLLAAACLRLSPPKKPTAALAPLLKGSEPPLDERLGRLLATRGPDVV